MSCSCTVEYICSQCNECIPHTHQRAWRQSTGAEGIRDFEVKSPEHTFVNEGWQKTLAGCEEYFWYHPVNSCWRRA